MALTVAGPTAAVLCMGSSVEGVQCCRDLLQDFLLCAAWRSPCTETCGTSHHVVWGLPQPCSRDEGHQHHDSQEGHRNGSNCTYGPLGSCTKRAYHKGTTTLVPAGLDQQDPRAWGDPQERACRGTGRLQYLSVWLSRNITQQVPRLPLTQLHGLFTLKPISRGQNQLLGYSTATASNSCAHRP